MQTLSEHHAYVLEADSIETSLLPPEYTTPSADVVHVVTDSFGIDDTRQLSQRVHRTAVSTGVRVFVVVVNSMTQQAQNALLKLVEEPPHNTRFFFIIPSVGKMIPTLRSRVEIIVTEASDVSNHYTVLQKMTLGEQLQMVTDKIKAKDTTWIQDVMVGGLKHAHSTKRHSELSGAVFSAERIDGPGASKKMLLEELLLSLHRK